MAENGKISRFFDESSAYIKLQFYRDKGHDILVER